MTVSRRAEAWCPRGRSNSPEQMTLRSRGPLRSIAELPHLVAVAIVKVHLGRVGVGVSHSSDRRTRLALDAEGVGVGDLPVGVCDLAVGAGGREVAAVADATECRSRRSSVVERRCGPPRNVRRGRTAADDSIRSARQPDPVRGGGFLRPAPSLCRRRMLPNREPGL